MTERESKQQKFLGALAACGLLGKAAKTAGTCRRTVANWREEDQAFDADVEQALLDYAELVEDEIDRRGRRGYEQAVWHQGEKVGKERKYSDKLLEMQAKSRMDKYREKGVEVDVNLGGVLVVGAPEDDLEAWRRKANKEPEETQDDESV